MFLTARHSCLYFAATLIALFGAVTSSWAQPLPKPEQHNKTVVVIHCDYSPVSFWDRNAGSPSGFFVDIMDNLSRQAGIKVDYICKSRWSELVSAIDSGEADAGVLLRSEEREKSMLFSTPLDAIDLSFFVRSQSSLDPDGTLKGHTVGVVTGGLACEELKKRPGLRLQTEDSYQDGIFKLLAGRIDVFAGEESMILKSARDAGLEDHIQKGKKPFLELFRCIAVRKNNPQLLDLLNRSLNGFVGSPEYQQIYLKWYGSPKPYWTGKKITAVGTFFLFIVVCSMALWRHRSILKINKELVRNVAEREQAEDALRVAVASAWEEKSKTEAIIAAMGDGINIQDTDYRILYQNQVSKDIYGDHIGRYCYRAFQEKDDPCEKCHLTFAFADGGIHKAERKRTTDQGLRHYEITASPLKDSTGKIIAGIEMIRDVTERKNAEEALRRSEERFRTLFLSLNQGFYLSEILYDEDGLPCDYRYVEVNPVFEEIMGLDRGQIIGRTFKQLLGPHHSSGWLDVFMTVAQTGIPADYTFYSDVFRRHFDALAFKPGEDQFAVLVADITERKRAEAELQLSRQWLSLHMEQTPLAVIEFSLDGRVREWNPAAARIFGYTREEALGRHWRFLVPENAWISLDTVWEEAVVQSRRGHFTNRNVTKDGRILDCEWFNTPLVDPAAKTIGVVSLGLDVTERIQAEEALRRHREELVNLVEERTRELTEANARLLKEIAERERMEAELLKSQKLESLGILAGGIAHDFNNLLATILSNISLAAFNLSEGRSASKQLTGAERASHQARDLARQLLTFSKGGAPVKRTQSLVELVKESAGFAMRGSRIRCDFSIPDDLWLVDADEGQLSQVIHNLVINADQSMPEGGTIEVRAENVVLGQGAVSLLPAGRYVKMMFMDAGVGIPPEHLSRIFDPYFTTKQRGSGLGLATTHSIVEKHGGSIVVESAPGVGSTFTVYLPASTAEQTASPIVDSGPYKGTGKVLFMDDNAGLRLATSDALGDLGYSVVCAEDGGQAIELYQEAMASGRPFDVVFMDITVRGGMGGQETMKRLLKIDPGVRAIVCSGYSNDPVMADHRRHGFVDVLVKPYNLNQLSAVVFRVMTGSAKQSSDGHVGLDSALRSE